MIFIAVKIMCKKSLLSFILLVLLSSTVLASSSGKTTAGEGSSRNWNEINRLTSAELKLYLGNSSFLDDLLRELPDAQEHFQAYWCGIFYISLAVTGELNVEEQSPTRFTVDDAIKLYEHLPAEIRHRMPFNISYYFAYGLFTLGLQVDKANRLSMLIPLLERLHQSPEFQNASSLWQYLIRYILCTLYNTKSINHQLAIKYGRKALTYDKLKLEDAVSIHEMLASSFSNLEISLENTEGIVFHIDKLYKLKGFSRLSHHLALEYHKLLSIAYSGGIAGVQKDSRKAFIHSNENRRLLAEKEKKRIYPAPPKEIKQILEEIRNKRLLREDARRSPTKSPTHRNTTSATTTPCAPAAAAAAAAPAPTTYARSNLAEKMRRDAVDTINQQEAKAAKRGRRERSNSSAKQAFSTQTDDEFLEEVALQPVPQVKISLPKRHFDTIGQIFSKQPSRIKMLDIRRLLDWIGTYRPGNGSHTVYKLTPDDIATLSEGIDETADDAALFAAVEDSNAEAVYLWNNDLLHIPKEAEDEDDSEETIDDGAAAAAPSRRPATTRNQIFVLPLRDEVADYLRLQLIEKLTALGITPETVVPKRK